MSFQIARFMICTKPWDVPVFGGGGIYCHAKEGDILTVGEANFARDIAEVGFGGILRQTVRIGDLAAHSRVADPEEFQKTLKHCQRCDRIEIEPGKWLPKPPCFSPRPGVKLVGETCPDCD